MGKAKRGRNRKRSKLHNPLGVPSEDSQDQEEFSNGDGKCISEKETSILTVVDQLQSSNVEDKIFGLHALANIFQDPQSVGEVLQHKIVKIAGPLLFERSSFVRNAAAGALRNLSACGSHEICDLLVEQDVMTPLAALIQQFATEGEPSAKKMKEGKVEDKVDTFVQAVHLLWNLCESNSTAVKYFNDRNLLSVLVPCLDNSTFGMESAVAVAQCLNTVTENNPAAIIKLKESEKQLEKLVSLEGEEALFLRTLASGLLLNLNNGKIIGLSPLIITQIMTTLSDTLAVDQRQVLNQLSSNMPMPEASNSPENFKKVENLKQARFLLEAQQTALEILANLFSDDNDDFMDEDLSDGSDENFSDSSLIEEEVSTTEKFPLSIPSEVHEAIIGLQLVQKTWEKTRFPAENVCQILAEHPDGKPLFSKVRTLRCRAFLCLNNLVSGLDLEDLGGPDRLHELWVDVGRLVFKEVRPDDIELLEAATAALRAALQRLAEIKPAPFTQLSDTDLQLMFNGVQQCVDANVRANLIRSVGTLGMIITNSSEESSQLMLKSIGKFLLEVGAKESELWVAAEALDTIMDVFGEDETDKAAAEINLVDKLNSLLPVLKHKVRSQRKSLGEHYLIVTTVNTNLSRFIKYKSNRLSGCNAKNGHM